MTDSLKKSPTTLQSSFITYGICHKKIHFAQLSFPLLDLTGALYTTVCQYRSSTLWDFHSTSVMPVTQDHVYSIDATQAHTKINHQKYAPHSQKCNLYLICNFKCSSPYLQHKEMNKPMQEHIPEPGHASYTHWTPLLFQESTKQNLHFPIISIPSPMSDHKSRVVWGLHCLRLSTVWSTKHPTRH